MNGTSRRQISVCILMSLGNKYPCILVKEKIFVNLQAPNPTKNYVQGKHCTLCYKCITVTAPSYLCDCIQVYTPSRTLRSSHTLSLSLRISHARLSTVDSQSCSVFGPSTWNDLPFLSDRTPPSNQTSRHVFFQNNRLARFSSHCSYLFLPQVPVCYNHHQHHHHHNNNNKGDYMFKCAN